MCCGAANGLLGSQSYQGGCVRQQTDFPNSRFTFISGMKVKRGGDFRDKLVGSKEDVVLGRIQVVDHHLAGLR